MIFLLKIKAFIKFYTELAVDNKASLIFTLLFPAIYQLFSTKIITIFSANDFIKISMPMIAYIIVSTALNGVTMSIIATRNSGFIKAYFYASGSRWAIYLANLLVQLLIVIFENIIFTLALMLLYKYYSAALLIYLTLMTLISFPIVSLGFNILFLFPIRQSSLSILSTSLLLGFLVLFNISIPNYFEVIKIINPYVFISSILRILVMPDFSSFINIGITSFIYIFLGILGYQLFKLQNRGLEN
ncbi:hypothetical protein ACTQX0_09415 [Lactobacillus amylovorus]|jgi:ABC-2 type transport system permease protein|uniref:hypothetical protein n=1 Tax=Lactobacillus amylovorus TaxID=1604 RepID=UPI003F949C3F